MSEEYTEAESQFNRIRSRFSVAVMAGVEGRSLSNAIISSETIEEFLARADAEILIKKALGE